MIAPTPSDVSTLWRFTKDSRDAHCILLPHPDGFELRYIFNGDVLIGAVTPDRGSLLERARQWRLRLVADGWEETEQNRSAMQVTVRAATRSAASAAPTA